MSSSVEPTRERNRTMLIALILLSVTLAAVAQLALKQGMNQATERAGEFRFAGESIRAVAATPTVWLGLMLFALSALVWLAVLSRTSLSFAYPFAAITYVLILIFDLVVLREQVPGLRWGGVALIAAGIFLVSRTHT